MLFGLTPFHGAHLHAQRNLHFFPASCSAPAKDVRARSAKPPDFALQLTSLDACAKL